MRVDEFGDWHIAGIFKGAFAAARSAVVFDADDNATDAGSGSGTNAVYAQPFVRDVGIFG